MTTETTNTGTLPNTGGVLTQSIASCTHDPFCVVLGDADGIVVTVLAKLRPHARVTSLYSNPASRRRIAEHARHDALMWDGHATDDYAGAAKEWRRSTLDLVVIAVPPLDSDTECLGLLIPWRSRVRYTGTLCVVGLTDEWRSALAEMVADGYLIPGLASATAWSGARGHPEDS